jgi:hypothetical protein
MTNLFKNNKPFDAMTDTEKTYAVIKKILWGFKAFGVFITLWGGWTAVIGIGIYIVTEIAMCAMYPEDILRAYDFWSKFRKQEEPVDLKAGKAEEKKDEIKVDSKDPATWPTS